MKKIIHTQQCGRPARSQSAQTGVMLLEAMVAILIFSLGVLSVIQLQAVSIKQATGAEYRSMAALLANDVISRMWASDKTANALQTNFSSSTAGASYTQWLSTVRNSGLPNVSSDKSTLPTVTFTTIPATASGPASSRAEVTVFWQEPGDTTTHSYIAVAQLR
ncbi:type IV pilus modification protein PilV [Aquabacterium sp.]|uniref:type IV pilus modification protein PilV n=1 Tax=Aquabacterium sp. TaxID=1872578 RepID=UPI0025BABD8D|nr:type IV pilus modification protein PilV [Aquabacterium sp.]